MYDEDIYTRSGIDRVKRSQETGAEMEGSNERQSKGLSRVTEYAVWFVFGWALFELPWELLSVESAQDAAALTSAKLLLAVLIFICFKGYVWARHVLLCVCCLSIFAIAPHLVVEFLNYPVAFVLSTVECIGKGIVVGLLASRQF
jgi:hypothetical protein